MTYRIVLARKAREQLNTLRDYIASVADEDTAARFAARLIEHLGTLDTFPHRGTPRGDLRPGLRTIAWRRRVTIGYAVREREVVILNLLYRGRDIDALLTDP